MAARGRQNDLPAEWDPMQAEFETSTYGAQSLEDENDASRGGDLDHCRLYVKNLPPLLNEEGLRKLFASFGRLTEAFISSDPSKNYGLIRYETPGEAKLAMESLNRVKPWDLYIHIAYKRSRPTVARVQNRRPYNNNSQQQNNHQQQRNGQREVAAAADQTYDDFNDTLSSSSKGRMSSRAYCSSLYTGSLWFTYTQQAYNALRIQYNNAFRMLLRLPRYCSASAMFVHASVDGFDALWRKKSASLLRRLRDSRNTIPAGIAERLDSQLLWKLLQRTKSCVVIRY